jgi:hypothetical protein
VKPCTMCRSRHRNLQRTEHTNPLAMPQTDTCRTCRLSVPRSSKWKPLLSVPALLVRHRTNCQRIDCSCSRTGRTSRWAPPGTGMCRTCRPSGPRSNKWSRQLVLRGQFRQCLRHSLWFRSQGGTKHWCVPSLRMHSGRGGSTPCSFHMHPLSFAMPNSTLLLAACQQAKATQASKSR